MKRNWNKTAEKHSQRFRKCFRVVSGWLLISTFYSCIFAQQKKNWTKLKQKFVSF